MFDKLTSKEKELISVSFLPYGEMACRMNISVNTVRTHRNNIFNKTNLKTHSDLVCFGVVSGLISQEEVSQYLNKKMEAVEENEILREHLLEYSF